MKSIGLQLEETEDEDGKQLIDTKDKLPLNVDSEIAPSEIAIEKVDETNSTVAESKTDEA